MRAIIITAALLGAACSGCVPKSKPPCKCECKDGRELPYRPPQVWEVGEERR